VTQPHSQDTQCNEGKSTKLSNNVPRVTPQTMIYQRSVRRLAAAFVRLADDMDWEAAPDILTLSCFSRRLELMFATFEAETEWPRALFHEANEKWEEWADDCHEYLERARAEFQLLFRQAASPCEDTSERESHFLGLLQLRLSQADTERVQNQIGTMLKEPAQKLARKLDATLREWSQKPNEIVLTLDANELAKVE
jgi:hypothetical protein